MSKIYGNIRIIFLVLSCIALTALTGCVSSGVHEALQQKADDTQSKLSDADKRLESLMQSNALLTSRTRELEEANELYADGLKECEFSIRESEDDCGDNTLALNDTIKGLKAELQLHVPLVLRAEAEARVAMAAEELATDLRIVFAEQIKVGDVSVSVEGVTVHIRASNGLVYTSKPPGLSKIGQKFLKKFVSSLERMGYSKVVVQSYTDDIEPTGTLKKKFATNWELSAARAASVTAYLSDHLDIDKSMLQAVGFSSNFPVADNSTREGRKLNRRLALVITPAREVAQVDDNTEIPAESELKEDEGSASVINSGEGL